MAGTERRDDGRTIVNSHLKETTAVFNAAGVCTAQKPSPARGASDEEGCRNFPSRVLSDLERDSRKSVSKTEFRLERWSCYNRLCQSEEKAMKKPRLYADFQNADVSGRVRLNCVGTTEDLAKQHVQLQEGLTVTLYSDDTENDGTPDELIVDGIVSYSNDEQCWVATIDWSAISHGADHQAVPRNGGAVPSVVGTEDSSHPLRHAP